MDIKEPRANRPADHGNHSSQNRFLPPEPLRGWCLKGTSPETTGHSLGPGYPGQRPAIVQFACPFGPPSRRRAFLTCFSLDTLSLG